MFRPQSACRHSEHFELSARIAIEPRLPKVGKPRVGVAPTPVGSSKAPTHFDHTRCSLRRNFRVDPSPFVHHLELDMKYSGRARKAAFKLILITLIAGVVLWGLLWLGSVV